MPSSEQHNMDALSCIIIARVMFGLGPPLPPRAVRPYDFVYGTRGQTAGALSLGHMVEFLDLLPDKLRAADVLWAGQCSSATRFSPEVCAYLVLIHPGIKGN